MYRYGQRLSDNEHSGRLFVGNLPPCMKQAKIDGRKWLIDL